MVKKVTILSMRFVNDLTCVYLSYITLAHWHPGQLVLHLCDKHNSSVGKIHIKYLCVVPRVFNAIPSNLAETKVAPVNNPYTHFSAHVISTHILQLLLHDHEFVKKCENAAAA